MHIQYNTWVSAIRTAWFSPRCPLCAAPISIDAALCNGCLADLPVLTAQCQHCALPLADKTTSRVCPDCAQRPRFDRAYAAFHYYEPIAWLIGSLKYHGQRAHARVLGDLLAERVIATAVTVPDILAPVPLHPTAFRHRGFNQAERIAARLEHRLGWPLHPELFRRVRATPRQSTLDASARAANVRGAFAAVGDLDGLRIALVDDVMTTTRTAAALAHCAMSAGATAVDVYCVARA